MANRNKLKLTVNKGGEEGPQYSLTYKANLRNHTSYDILSVLVGDRDVVMTVSTDLIFGMRGKESWYVEEFLNRVKEKGLSHCARTVPSSKTFTLFGFSINRKKKEQAREIAVYVPGEVWRREDTPGLLPAYGAQYFAAKAPMDPDDTVARVLDMSRAETAEAFVLDVYDISALGQMGFNARGMEEEEIKRLLEL